MGFDYYEVDLALERASVQEIVADVLKGAGISPEPPRPAAPAPATTEPPKMVDQVRAMGGERKS